MAIKISGSTKSLEKIRQLHNININNNINNNGDGDGDDGLSNNLSKKKAKYDEENDDITH